MHEAFSANTFPDLSEQVHNMIDYHIKILGDYKWWSLLYSACTPICEIIGKI